MSHTTPASSTAPAVATKRRLAPLFVYALLVLVIAACGAGIQQTTARLREASDIGNKRINLAGRQRALSQRMTKALLFLERDVLAGAKGDAPRAEMTKISGIFDSVLHGFDAGGTVPGTDGKEFLMPKTSDSVESQILRDALELWLPLKERLADLSAKTPEPAALAAAVDYARDRNVKIFDLMNQLTNRTEVTAAAAIAVHSGRRNILIALGSIACFLVPGFFLWDRARIARKRAEITLGDLVGANATLEQKTAAIASAKQETDRIMDTIQEGLLLIDQQGIIGAQYSQELTRIFRETELAGRPLLSILQRLLTEKAFRTTKSYFDLLFDSQLKEKQVLKVNPLVDIEVNFSNPEGGFVTRYLGFSFRRIIENSTVTRVFVAVRDVTAQVELERRLRETEKHKERQLEMLLGIVHVDPEALDGFVKLIETELGHISEALRAEDFAAPSGQRNEQLHERLTVVRRAIHNLKGNAAYLDLDYFVKTTEDFERKIHDLLNRPALNGDDFLSIVVAQASLRADLADLTELRGKLGNLRRAAPAATTSAEPAAPAVDPVSEGLRTLVTEVSARTGCEAAIELDPAVLPILGRQRRELVRDVLIQLTRNALAHSIETPSDRERAGKPRAARLHVRPLPRTADGLVGFAFRDDGRGLDLEKIRRRAELTGILSVEATASPEEIARCIFAPGFSTAETAGPDAGRGMGMDIIKTRIIDEAGGAIEVRSAPGRHCEFAIYLPEITESTV